MGSAVVENIDQLLKENPVDLIVHVGTNDLTKNVKLLNNLKKIVKQVFREGQEGQNEIKVYQKQTLT